MEAIKRQIKFQLADGKSAFIYFWAIILVVSFLSYIVNGAFNNGTGGVIYGSSINGNQGELISVASAHLVSIFIFIIVYSMVMYYESFPMAISFSASRKDFYIGAVAHNIIFTLSMAIIQGVLMKLDGFIIEAIGRSPLYELVIFNTKEDNVLYIIFTLFIIFLFIASLLNLLGAALYRFTWKLWIPIGGITMAVLNLKVLFNPVMALYTKIIDFIDFEHSPFVLVFTMLITSAILYLLAFLLIRKISIRSRA